MSTVAVVPVKSLAEAKRRLSQQLTSHERRLLVLAMLEDVLSAVQASNVFKETTVISPDRIVTTTAEKHGARSLLQSGPGLNHAVQQATTQAVKEGATATVNILADTPLVQAIDFEEIVQMGEGTTRVVLSPSLDGGTNIMLRSPATVIDNSYGRWSFSHHLRSAQKMQIRVYAVSNARTSFDIDTIDDLRTIV
ncbi:MAG TPA: 2-phospho-L-lactate guanylyltransferase, partial [Candidatus Binatus sp.]|nr:2-phospho-L-lactate guanylyltransferase [Candidatus Binatus sp.]